MIVPRLLSVNADPIRILQEHVLRAPRDGVVERVIATVGELVPEGKVLVRFVEEEVPAAE